MDPDSAGLFATKLPKKGGEKSEKKVLPNFPQTFLRITLHIRGHILKFANVIFARKIFPGCRVMLSLIKVSRT